MPAIVSFAMLPFMAGFLLLGEPLAALACFVPGYAVANMYVGPLWSTAQNLARPGMRATASAVLLLILNIVGLGLGPFLVGLLNDALTARFGAEAIRWSLLLVAGIGSSAGLFFWIGSASLREDLSSASSAASLTGR